MVHQGAVCAIIDIIDVSMGKVLVRPLRWWAESSLLPTAPW